MEKMKIDFGSIHIFRRNKQEQYLRGGDYMAKEKKEYAEDQLLHSIEFLGEKIFTIITYSRYQSYGEYHVEYDGEEQGWWHWAGGGPIDDLVFERGEGLAKVGFPEVSTLGDLIEKYDLMQGECEYCNICEEVFSEENAYYIEEVEFNGKIYEDTYALCEHVFWNSEEGFWYGPGSDEYYEEKRYSKESSEKG